jgi:hypothetical protein
MFDAFMTRRRGHPVVGNERTYRGLSLDHQRDLQALEFRAVSEITRYTLLGSPLWFLLWPVWLFAARGAVSSTVGSGRKTSQSRTSRRMEAVIVHAVQQAKQDGLPMNMASPLSV